MKTLKNKALKSFSEYFQIGLGIVLASIGLKAFLLPNGFMDGGVTGIALLVVFMLFHFSPINRLIQLLWMFTSSG